MRRTLKLLLLLGIGLALAGKKPDSPSGKPGEFDDVDIPPKFKGLQGNSTPENHADIDGKLDKGEPGSAENGSTTDDPAAPPKSSDSITFPQTILNKKFKHAIDFGIDGNNNRANQQAFQEALTTHIDGPNTQAITGTYRGNDAVHYFDPNTGLNVVTTPDGKLVSAWKLSEAQQWHLLNGGNLGGG